LQIRGFLLGERAPVKAPVTFSSSSDIGRSTLRPYRASLPLSFFGRGSACIDSEPHA
jgi:hypothetical protein